MLDVRCSIFLTCLVVLLTTSCRPSAPSTLDPRPSPLDSPSLPYTNSLGMIFVPVPGTKVQFCIWETRVQDFEAFVNATGYDATQDVFSLKDGGWVQNGHTWKNPGFEQGPTHPATGLSWDDAKAFCAWLTEKERKAGLIETSAAYRLPADSEWSSALGIPKEGGATPSERHKTAGLGVLAHAQRVGRANVHERLAADAGYPWGKSWPPPQGFGNYPEELHVDSYAVTAPVGSFRPTSAGLFDLSGNVWEWCEDSYSKGDTRRVYRGGSFIQTMQISFASWARGFGEPTERYVGRGFRAVLAPAP